MGAGNEARPGPPSDPSRLGRDRHRFGRPGGGPQNGGGGGTRRRRSDAPGGEVVGRRSSRRRCGGSGRRRNGPRGERPGPGVESPAARSQCRQCRIPCRGRTIPNRRGVGSAGIRGLSDLAPDDGQCGTPRWPHRRGTERCRGGEGGEPPGGRHRSDRRR